MDDMTRLRARRQAKHPELAPQSDSVVFLVTAGMDDDYRIVGAFSTYELAEAFAARARGALGSINTLDRTSVEGWTVDELAGSGGAFRCTVGRTDDHDTHWGYEVGGNPARPADTCDAVELDGVPQHFTGYGATLEEARVAAVALRDSMVQT